MQIYRRLFRMPDPTKNNAAMSRPKADSMISLIPTPVMGIICLSAGGGGTGPNCATTGRSDDETLEDDEKELLEKELEKMNIDELDRELELLLLESEPGKLDEKTDELLLEEDSEEPTVLLLEDEAALHPGAVITSLSVVTVPPKASANPDHSVFAPTVMPAGAMMMPANEVFAPSVTA